VFRRLWARVTSGECLVVTGPNGSGKSTLLALIAGLLAPDEGEIRVEIEGRRMEPASSRRHIGLVSPDLTLYEELTALENLEFLARVRSLAWSRLEGEALLERVGLQGRGRDLVGTYSSGMRVRLKYCCALQSRPSLLLLDEPTAMLDAGGAGMVEELVGEQKQRGVLVLATNDPRETRHGDLFLDLGRSG